MPDELTVSAVCRLLAYVAYTLAVSIDYIGCMVHIFYAWRR